MPATRQKPLSEDTLLALKLAVLQSRGLSMPSITGPSAPKGTHDFSSLRGGAKAFVDCQEQETILAGPADTGKTYASCMYVNSLMWKYPKAQGVVMRKTYASIIGSFLVTLKKIMGPIPVAYGGNKPEWFDYPNGSRLWVAGLDNADRVLSSERDFFYLNQAEEFTLSDWETMLSRCTGRGAVMPFTRMMGDCNPGPPNHWIKQRESLTLFQSRHEDNPTIFDANGVIIPGAQKRIDILDRMSGSRYQRLRLGKWSQAEGAVYEDWDTSVHLLDRGNSPSLYDKDGKICIPKEWPRWMTVDFGFNNPFVAQWWTKNPDGDLIMYREIYMSQRLVEDHAAQIIRLSEGERIIQTYCDHDREDRETLSRHGVPNAPAYKDIERGIGAVGARLKKGKNGKPRLYLMRNALVEVDPELAETKQPICTEQEFDMYVWPKAVDGKSLKEVPVDAWNHGMDALRYFVASQDVKGGGLQRYKAIMDQMTGATA